MPTFNGTPGDDFLNGTSGDDVINGLAGDDVLRGRGGNDQLHGGDGSDNLDGGDGDDQLYGDDGDDYLRGSAGNDLLDGGNGFDRAAYFTSLAGVTVDLRIQNGAAQDTGGAGFDTLLNIEHLSGSIYTDTLYGNDNDNLLWALGPTNGVTPTNDNLYGNGGNDLLWVGTGDHILDGGTGTDAVTFDNPGDIFQIAPDPVHGYGDGIVIDLNLQGVAQDTRQGMMTLIGIENVSGSVLDDVIIGNGGANVLAGEAGNDQLFGGGGNDTLYGDGAITIDSGIGNSGPIVTLTADQGTHVDFYDVDGKFVWTYVAGELLYDAQGHPYAYQDLTDVNGDSFRRFTVNGVDFDFYAGDLTGSDGVGGGSDFLDGGTGDDTLYGGGGNDNLAGGSGASSGNDYLDGGDGDDMLRGGAGDDTLIGGAGVDRVRYYEGTALTAGVTVDLNIVGVSQNTGRGMDTISGVENVSGTQFADTLTGDGGDNWLWGLTANATGTFSAANNDTIDGRGGNDLITVGIGNHLLEGGSGNDTLRFTENGAITETGITVSLLLQGSAQDTGNGNGSWTISGFENLSGGQGGDHLTGDNSANRLTGEGGDDTLVGGGGDDILSGDGAWDVDTHGTGYSGSARLMFDPTMTGNDTLDGGDGDDTALFLLASGPGTLSYGADGGDLVVKRDGADVARISFDTGHVTVTGLGAAINLGTDTLTNIETIRFTIDGGATLDIPISSGAVIDGYVRDAFVFVDLDNNGVFTTGEPNTITDANGNFTLPGGGSLIMSGGTDIATGLPNILEYRAPEGSSVLSPLTTLVQFLMDNHPGLSLADAMDEVRTAFGLPNTIDLTTFDPFAQSPGSADALAVAQASSEVEVLVQLGGQLAGNDDLTQLSIFDYLSGLVHSGPVDLTDSAVVADVLNTVLNPPPTQSQIDNIANRNADIDAATSLGDVADAQQAALSVSVGNLVFLDVNHNGVFDGLDTGIDNVTVQLLDSTATNVLATTTTAGGGLYNFAGLSGGDYVVRVVGSSLPAGYSSVPGANDPDDNVDNDDNGAPNAANYDSAPITLSPGDEPDGNTNNTLDFGFVAAPAPSVDLNGAGAGIDYAGGYTENGAGAAIGSTIDVTSTLPVTSATITITDAIAGDALNVSGTLPATITVLSGAGTATLTLTGTGSDADWEAALALVRYASSSDNPDNYGTDAARSISVTVSDGVTASTPAIATIAITAVNDDPTVGNFNGDSVSYTEGDPYVLLDQNAPATVTDPDSANFDGGRLSFGQISGALPEDSLFILNAPGVSTSGNDVYVNNILIGTIVAPNVGEMLAVVFNSAATSDLVATLIDYVAYTNTAGDNPHAGPRSIAYILTDGDGGATGGGVTVNVAAVQDRVLLYDGSNHLVGDYSTIQAAINAASNGYRIVASAGTYGESLNVDKDVTIEGANAGTAGTGSRGAETVITGNVTIAAAGVTIDGVEVTGAAADALGTTGVVVQGGANGFSLVNSVLNGTGDLGMIVGLVTGLDVGRNLIEGYSSGIYVAGGGTTGSVHDNSFQGDGPTNNTGLQNGVLSETTHVTISGNAFDALDGGSLFLFPSGPDTIDLDTYISGNTITNSGAARPVQIIPTELTHNVIGTDFNEAFDGETAAAPVNLGGGGVTGSFSFDGQGGDDKAWGGGQGDTFTGGAGNDELFGNGGSDTAVFSGNRAGYSIVVTTNASGVVTGFSSVTDTNPGNGDDGTDTLHSIERLQFADTTLDLGQRVQLFDGSGKLVGTFNDIQAAINAASDGYRIEAQAGTYNESLTVDKDVTIEGANAGLAGTDNARGPETVITGQVTISAAGVTIDGVEITGAEADVLGTTGVVVEGGANNFSFVNSILANVGGDLGMIVGLVTGLDVGHNLIQLYSSAMYVAGGSTTGSVHDNIFQRLDVGLQSETTHVTITGNTFDGIAGGSLFLFPSGPDSVDLDTYISGNTITDSGAARPVQIIPTDLTHNVIGTDYNEAFDGETAAFYGVTGSFSFDGQGGDDKAWGGQEGDTLTGGAGNDTLYGEGGNDILSGGLGNDSLNGDLGNTGDPGIDTATYAGNRGDYSIVVTTNASGVVTGFSSVTDNNAGNGDEGTDTLTSIERLQFSNVTLDLTQRVQLFDGAGHLVGTFNDIQAAINAASDGYRIEAQAGLYSESLNVNKDVTIEGANAGTAGSGARGAETVITGSVTIAADGVTINGVEITGAGAGPIGSTGVIVNSGSDNFSLVDSLLHGSGDFAIFVGGVTGLDIGSNRIDGYSIGMYIATGETAGSVHDNLFHGDGPGSGTGLQDGLNSETTHVTITGNTFDGIDGGSLFLFPSGPDSVDLDSYISGNTITNSGIDRPVQIIPTQLTRGIL